MHVITRRRLLSFGKKYHDAASPLDRWYRIVKRTHFDSYSSLNKVFPSCDQVGELIVFNIGGNKYRLITYINFNKKRIYIREILTHNEYDKGKWKQ